MHIIFSSHTCSGSQTISKLCILTIKFICSKRKYHSCSLAQHAIGLPYGITTLPCPRHFSSCHFNFPQPNKLLVFMHIIFSKSCILTVQVIFIYSRVQRKNKYHYLCMHHFNILNFPNAIQISNDFNQCANIHGHIHNQCTLALISSLPHFMTNTLPWCVGAQPTSSPYGLFIIVHYCNMTVLLGIG
jgi:hypothetical protein